MYFDLLSSNFCETFIENCPTTDVTNIKLTELSEKNIFADHWTKNLTRHVLVMLMYLRDEREGDFALQ